MIATVVHGLLICMALIGQTTMDEYRGRIKHHSERCKSF
jgi:hypothetical protein